MRAWKTCNKCPVSGQSSPGASAPRSTTESGTVLAENTQTKERIARLLVDSPIVDGHNDLPWALRLADADVEDLDVAGPLPQFHTDLDRMAAGGVGVQWWSVYVPSTLPEDESLRATIEQVYLVHRMVARHADRLALAINADDVGKALADGKIASLIGAEGGHSIGGTL